VQRKSVNLRDRYLLPPVSRLALWQVAAIAFVDVAHLYISLVASFGRLVDLQVRNGDAIRVPKPPSAVGSHDIAANNQVATNG